MPYVIQYLRQEEKRKMHEMHVMKNEADDQQKQQRLPGRIVLTGFRATGKTAVGHILARLTRFRFLDTDKEISQRMGCSIAESVRQHGWQAFRTQERALLGELCSWRETIIATGGGAILHHEEWQKLRQDALVIWLRTDLATTLSRLTLDQKTAEQRPALGEQEDGQDPAKEIAALLAEREPLYRAGSDLVFNTEGKTSEELAAAIYEQL
ncbi:MAG: shikimate kinase [Candidatus Electrothrix sp. ATG1]|nr:shikimate kinase [Candidatus Electrothrix sp. ATG1]